MVTSFSSISSQLTTPYLDYEWEFLTRGYAPMNEIALYMTILAAMFDLSYKPKGNAIPNFRTWSVPQYNVRVAVKADQVCFAMWGLLYGFLRNLQFWPMSMKMSSDGVEVGQINISYQRESSNFLESNTTQDAEVSPQSPRLLIPSRGLQQNISASLLGNASCVD